MVRFEFGERAPQRGLVAVAVQPRSQVWFRAQRGRTYYILVDAHEESPEGGDFRLAPYDGGARAAGLELQVDEPQTVEDAIASGIRARSPAFARAASS